MERAQRSTRSNRMDLKRTYTSKCLLLFFLENLRNKYTRILGTHVSLQVKVASMDWRISGFDSIQWILVSRLILNLKNVTTHDTRTTSARGDRIPDNPFASGLFLGNLGAPLRTYHDQDQTDHELIGDGYRCIEETNVIRAQNESRV